MKTMKKFVLGLFVATGLSSPAFAEATPLMQAAATALQGNAAARLPDADPAMWVVRDEDTTIYLFGTFHLMDGKADWFNDEVKEAFDRSQELVVEVEIPEDQAKMAAQFQPIVARFGPDKEGRSLKNQLSAEEYKMLYDTLGPLGVPAGAIDPMRPWFASFMLMGATSQKLGLSPENGAEFILKRAARERNMTIGQVETLEGQIEMLSSAAHDKQLTALKEQLKNMDEMNKMLPRMLTVWNSGDAEGLDAVMNEGLGDDPELRRVLLGARNEKWAEWIDQRMDRPGTVFMAVGAGHLVGSDSVQNFLRQRGIQSSRVPAAGGRNASTRSTGTRTGAGMPGAYPVCRSRTQDRCVQRGGR
jgi:uncharacterized protein YbaP (TraB family)